MPTGIWLAGYITLWVLLLIETALMVGLIRHIANLNAFYVKSDPDAGLPLGVLAPGLVGADIEDRPVSLGSVNGRKTLIYFLSTGCPSCREVMGRAFRLSQIDGVDLVLNITASKTRTELYMAEFWRGIRPATFALLPDVHRDNYDHYQVTSVPFAVVVDEDGRIGAKGSPLGFVEVARLIEQANQLRLKRLGEQAEPSAIPTEPALAISAAGRDSEL